MTDQTFFNLLAEDKELITYRKSLNKMTGSVTSTILLQQIIYWAKKKQGQPFYKFREPCGHALYSNGDSWTEELGFSPCEFDTALSHIGTKVTKGISKSDVIAREDAKSLVIYWTDASRVTWYMLNIDLLGKLGKLIYLVKQESEITLELEKPNLPLTETPTETPTEEREPSLPGKANGAKPPKEPLADILEYANKGVSEASAPNPQDQYWQHRDPALQVAQVNLGQFNQVEKDDILALVILPDFDLTRWENSAKDTVRHYKGQGKVARAIEIYHAGGNYDAWRRKTYETETPIKPSSKLSFGAV